MEQNQTSSNKNHAKKIFLCKKTKKTQCNHSNKFISNPSINHINYNSFFIFDQTDYIKYFNSLQNKNLIKCNIEEIKMMKSACLKNHSILDLNKKIDVIYIENNIAEKLKKFFTKPDSNSELGIYLKSEILNSENRANLSCRKLANKYFLDRGSKVSKSTVNNVLRKELNFHYLKTCYKSNFLKKETGLLYSFGFIKTFIKCIKLGFEPIYIDESKIELINNHLKCWRYVNETIYFGNANKNKNNLLLAIGKDFVLHYKIIQENTNSEIFLEFIKEINDIIKVNKSKKYFLIMDNLICHINDKVIDFLVKSNLCSIFTAPCNSIFNAAELSFRAIKRKIYTNI